LLALTSTKERRKESLKMGLHKFWSFSVILISIQFFQEARLQETEDRGLFRTELFLNSNDLNAGLYEGQVKGRRRFGDTQVPHGEGTIYYFTTDKFNRVNYTGDWVNGQREGNGSTSFKDGAVYQGGYKKGLEDGHGFIRYENGNTLDAEFVAGKIQGHGVFRYANGDQREGFFKDNILDGQVIFTRRDGFTVIEQWEDGKQVQEEDVVPLSSFDQKSKVEKALPSRNEIQVEITKPPPSPTPSISARGGGNRWRNQRKKTGKDQGGSVETIRLAQLARTRARSFLFDVFSGVN